MSQSSEEDERQKEGGREKRGCRRVVAIRPNSATSALSLLLFHQGQRPHHPILLSPFKVLLLSWAAWVNTARSWAEAGQTARGTGLSHEGRLEGHPEN